VWATEALVAHWNCWMEGPRQREEPYQACTPLSADAHGSSQKRDQRSLLGQEGDAQGDFE